MKQHRIILPLALLALPLVAEAQFNQSISVEGKYVPEVFRLDRINAFPQPVRFNLESSPLAYDGRSVPASFAPRLLALPATGWRATRDFSDARGYLELGAGSWLNTTLSAGYRFINSPETTVGIRLQHNSTSLWKPEVSDINPDIRQYRYDESLGIFGSHLFDGYGRLEAGVDWHIGNFNYYGTNIPFLDGGANPGGDMKAPSQTLNDVAARVGWHSQSAHDDISWRAEAGVRYFGYRRMYIDEINLDNETFESVPSTRETDINVNGGFNFPTSTKSAVGIDVNVDVVTYGGYKPENIPSHNSFLRNQPEKPGSYGLFTLTPYYRFTRDKLIVNIGADIDISTGAGPENDRYKTFHIAPDVRVDYQAGPAALYLHLLGGTRKHTLAETYQLDYYQMPFVTNTAPTHSPLDGELGVAFGPFSGFSAGVNFAYRITKGEYLGGWSQTSLNGNSPYADDLPISIDETTYLNYDFLSPYRIDLSGFSIGANAALDLGKILKLKAKGNYQSQKGDKGYFNGYDRPRWTARVEAETNPWSTLKFSLAYDYRGVRNIYTMATTESVTTPGEQILVSRRLPDITYLNFGASYSFTPKISVWLQADNLLNRHDEWLPGLPTQGVRVMGGVGFIF